MGAVTLGQPIAVSMGVLAVAWAIVLPALVLAADRLLGSSRETRLPSASDRPEA